ncbi:MAG TPA: DR2241 family protein [Chthoniobacterales bacterium]|nr:DR2241 family protein [Chthoniobacterales bacterium]
MLDPVEQALEREIGESCCIGEIFIRPTPVGGFALCHRDDESNDAVQIFRGAEAAVEIAKYDDRGNYRPLKTAPTLRHGWRLELVDLAELRRALDYLYPGRLAMLSAWKQHRLATPPLRETLDRQSGMYRVAAKISDGQIDEVVGNFCRSDGGCLRTILWRRDGTGKIASTKLPPQKFDPSHDQTGRGQRAIPMLCQEACHLLVNECRKAVKAE